MTEPYVQVPASLIERAKQFDRRGGLGSDVHAWLQQLRALLSQPEPSAETVTPVCLFAHDVVAAGGYCRRCGAQLVDPSTIRDVREPEQ